MVFKSKKPKAFIPILALIIIAAIVFTIAGIIVVIITSSGKKNIPKPVELNIWGVMDNESDLKPIINAYQGQHPYVKIVYRKLRYDEYEDALINAWAKGEGPDIYSIPATWINKYRSNGFSSPMPPSTTMTYYTITKTLGIKEDVKYEKRTKPSINLNYLRTNLVDVVSEDTVFENQIYGLPLSIDTLVMFYNKDLLNKAHIPEPPKTWEEFIQYVPLLTIEDKSGNIVQSGTALGTANNITNATDILSLLMLQNGATMVTGSTVSFDQGAAAREALRFYTDFASPNKEVYCWNKNMPDALEAFATGQVAFFFGYNYQTPDIKSKGPKLNFGITFLPQLAPNQETNYANYWVETVSRASIYKNEAWDFIQFAADKSQVMSYLNQTGQASVIRSIIKAQVNDPNSNIYIFANQTLTAKSWYHGRNFDKMKQYFEEMIDSVAEGTADYEEAIATAVKRVQGTY